MRASCVFTEASSLPFSPERRDRVASAAFISSAKGERWAASASALSSAAIRSLRSSTRLSWAETRSLKASSTPESPASSASESFRSCAFSAAPISTFLSCRAARQASKPSRISRSRSLYLAAMSAYSRVSLERSARADSNDACSAFSCPSSSISACIPMPSYFFRSLGIFSNLSLRAPISWSRDESSRLYFSCNSESLSLHFCCRTSVSSTCFSRMGIRSCEYRRA